MSANGRAGRVGNMREGGGLVGRRAVGTLGVGRRFPKKNFDSGVGQKKSGIKTVPGKKKKN